MSMTFNCPICGYAGLVSPPFDEWGSPSDDQCSSCSYAFRMPDDPRAWRAAWIAGGMCFAAGTPPTGFDPVAQLGNAMHPLPRTWALLGDSYRTKTYGRGRVNPVAITDTRTSDVVSV